MFRLVRNLIFLVFIFFVGYLFGIKEVRFYKVVSSSMQPTLKPGDRQISVKPGKLRRYDIVNLIAPQGTPDILVKRVIGLPGETIEIKSGEVLIGREKISEPYLLEKPDYELKMVIPANCYFLLGDNRNQSEDSSLWGPVSRNRITGRVVFIYWPRSSLRIVR